MCSLLVGSFNHFLLKNRSPSKRRWKGVHKDQRDSFLNKKVITVEEKVEGVPQVPN